MAASGVMYVMYDQDDVCGVQLYSPFQSCHTPSKIVFLQSPINLSQYQLGHHHWNYGTREKGKYSTRSSHIIILILSLSHRYPLFKFLRTHTLSQMMHLMIIDKQTTNY